MLVFDDSDVKKEIRIADFVSLPAESWTETSLYALSNQRGFSSAMHF